MSCIQEQKLIISQIKHKFISNTQTSIGYVNNGDKIAIYEIFGKQLFSLKDLWIEGGKFTTGGPVASVTECILA